MDTGCWAQVAKAADARSYWGAIMPDVVANHDAEVSAGFDSEIILLEAQCNGGTPC